MAALAAVALITGGEYTVTITVPEPEHPSAEIPVTVYVVDADGLAVTSGPVVVSRSVPGDHE